MVSKILGYLIGFWFFVLLLALFWQVIARFLVNASSSWTEELASYSLVWIVMIGIGIGVHELTIPKVEIFTNYLPKRAQDILEIIVHALCCLLFLVFAVKGIQMAEKMLPQKVASLKISVTYFYLAIPVGGIVDLFFSVEHILKGIVKLRGAAPSLESGGMN
ncbi:MAG: TRAP transporter small permease [Oscillospiraceae bacterium]